MAVLLDLPHPHVSSMPLYIQWRSLSAAASTLPVNRHCRTSDASSDGKRHLTRELGITLHQGAKFVASGRELQNLGRNSPRKDLRLWDCGTWLPHIHILLKVSVEAFQLTIRPNPSISQLFFVIKCLSVNSPGSLAVTGPAKHRR